jgi:hypothetical protein
MKCPACTEEMALEEKDTSSGRDMRTYRCSHCGRSEDIDNGIALWQVLSAAREADEIQSRKKNARAAGQAPAPKRRGILRLADLFRSESRKRSR